jgi:DNA-binding NtrC family response regulator
VTGETGTGKELVARAIHDLSPRSAGPFLAVNCAALADGVLESELFGHVRGAFTGAASDRQGLFRSAGGGVILLDEVGDMSLRLQQRFLRVLEEREVTPVGYSRTVPVDVRVVAATRRDLRRECEVGRFRDDLFFRLNVFRIDLPPLRERRTDIPLLLEAALDRLRRRSSLPVPEGCTTAAVRALREYDWPGNIRELFSVVESAALLSRGARIGVQHLPPELRANAAEAESLGNDRYRAPEGDDDERRAIVAALERAEGKKTRAARALGMSRTTLWRKIKEYGLEPD